MSWSYSVRSKALRQLRKLGPGASARIFAYLDSRVAGEDDPRRFGKSLKGSLAEFWRYRVDDYRVICKIDDGELVVLVVRVGHRRNVYG